jgi:2-methylcitrate dehydratase PrpD
VANALIRGSARLEHFEESLIRDGKVAEFTKKITVTPDKSLEERGHTPMDMRVRTRGGREFFRQLDIGPGFPGNPLTREDHEKRFQDCLGFAKKPISRKGATEVAAMIENFEKVADVRQFVQLLLI